MNEEQPPTVTPSAAPGAGSSSSPGPEATVTPAPPQHGLKRIVLIVVGVLVLMSVVWFVVGLVSKTKAPGKNGQSSAAQKMFNEMLTAAASQSRTRLTYVEKGYGSKADLAAHVVKDQLYAVSELDVPSKDYRAVYANQLGSGTNLVYFTLRRCLGGQMFGPDSFAFAYKTLDSAKAGLARPFTVTVTDSEAQDCSLANPDHPGRVTDGIIPVGLNSDQIKGWLDELWASDFVRVEDKGATTYKQKAVHKLRITTNSLAGTGSFFESVKKGTGLQLTTDRGLVGPDSFRLDRMATSDNIDGFYLFDEQTKLPVYSEFTAASLSGNDQKPGKVLKQAYDYPPSLSLDQSSTINTLE